MRGYRGHFLQIYLSFFFCYLVAGQIKLFIADICTRTMVRSQIQDLSWLYRVIIWISYQIISKKKKRGKNIGGKETRYIQRNFTDFLGVLRWFSGIKLILYSVYYYKIDCAWPSYELTRTISLNWFFLNSHEIPPTVPRAIDEQTFLRLGRKSIITTYKFWFRRVNVSSTRVEMD